MPGWLARVGEPQQDLPQAALLVEKGGTGGALFRASIATSSTSAPG